MTWLQCFGEMVKEEVEKQAAGELLEKKLVSRNVMGYLLFECKIVKLLEILSCLFPY